MRILTMLLIGLLCLVGLNSCLLVDGETPDTVVVENKTPDVVVVEDETPDVVVVEDKTPDVNIHVDE